MHRPAHDGSLERTTVLGTPTETEEARAVTARQADGVADAARVSAGVAESALRDLESGDGLFASAVGHRRSTTISRTHPFPNSGFYWGVTMPKFAGRPLPEFAGCIFVCFGPKTPRTQSVVSSTTTKLWAGDQF